MDFYVLKWVTEKIEDPEVLSYLLSVLMRIEMRAKLEAIEEFTTILSEIEEKKMSINTLREYVNDWYSEIENIYMNENSFQDPLFTPFFERLRRRIKPMIKAI